MEQALCPVQMVAAARAGYYDDFRSDLAFPLIALVDELRAIGQHPLAERVVAGEFDGTTEESDAWARSPDGQAAFRELTRRPNKIRERPMSEQPREQKIGVESIFGHNTRRPAVQIVVPRTVRAPVMRPGPTGPVEDRDVFGLQLSPDEARSLALNLLEAAEAAIGEGFVMDFFTREMDLTLEQAAPLMLKLRGYRQRNEAAGT